MKILCYLQVWMPMASNAHPLGIVGLEAYLCQIKSTLQISLGLEKCLFSADRMVRTNDNHMQKFATEKRFGLGHFDEVCHCIQNTNYALKISN